MIKMVDPAFGEFVEAFMNVALPVKRIESYGGVGWKSSVLFREYPYQAECFRLAPNLDVVPHSHPHVDGAEWFQSGSGIFMIKGHHFPMPGKGSRSRVIRVDAGVLHGASTGPRGLIFVSLQKWHIREMTSVSVDWDGPTEPTCLRALTEVET